MTGLGEDLDVDAGPGFLRSGIDRGDQCRNVGDFRSLVAGTALAVKIPEIDTFGEGFSTLALQVLSEIVLDRLDHTRWL